MTVAGCTGQEMWLSGRSLGLARAKSPKPGHHPAQGGHQGVVRGWDGGSHFSSRVGWKLGERKELVLKPQDTH